MKYDQKALYAELTHFYLSICEKEQVDEPRIRGLVGSLVRKARQAIPEEWDDKAKIHQLLQLFYVIGDFIAMRIIISMPVIYTFHIF